MTVFPKNPQTIKPEFDCPVFYWPLNTDKVSEIGVHAKKFGKLNLYPQNHVDLVKRIAHEQGFPFYINPIMFNMVPQIDLPPSENPEYVSDQYGIMTCDLLQVLYRAHTTNVVSCHTFSGGSHYGGQFGYIGNPFFGTFWIYKNAESKQTFDDRLSTNLENLFWSVEHKRTPMPIASVNFFVGYDIVTGEKTVMLTRVYGDGDNEHKTNALPKLMAELERQGYKVASHTGWLLHNNLLEPERGNFKFNTIPTYLTVRASDHNKAALVPYRYDDIPNPRSVKVLVQDYESGFDYSTYMVGECHSARELRASQLCIRPLRAKEMSKSDLFLSLAAIENSPHCRAGLNYEDNPEGAVYETCEGCGDRDSILELRFNTHDECYYCTSCLDENFVRDTDTCYIPRADCTEVRHNTWITPRILERGYVFSTHQNRWVLKSQAKFSKMVDSWLEGGAFIEELDDYVPGDLVGFSYQYGKAILKENAVYCEYGDDWVYAKDATWVPLLKSFVPSSHMENGTTVYVEGSNGWTYEITLPYDSMTAHYRHYANELRNLFRYMINDVLDGLSTRQINVAVCEALGQDSYYSQRDLTLDDIPSYPPEAELSEWKRVRKGRKAPIAKPVDEDGDFELIEDLINFDDLVPA